MNDKNNSLEKIEGFVKHILVVQLYQSGVSQQQIAKQLKLSKTTVNDLLKGVQKRVVQNENSRS